VTTGKPSTCTPRRWPLIAASATAIARAAKLDNLGRCYLSLGEYRQATDTQTEALSITRHISDRYNEESALTYLGRAWLASGDAQQAVTLLNQAVSVADSTSDIEPAAVARSWLARVYLLAGDPAAALAASAAGREWPYPTEELTLLLLEALALLELDGSTMRSRLQRRAHRRGYAAGPRRPERGRAAGSGLGAEWARRGHLRPDPGHRSSGGVRPGPSRHQRSGPGSRY
jgi:tetratricopeptide (TPR) repeat protein